MGRKRFSKGVLALDCSDNKLEEKNAVEVTEGALMRTQGTVKHIFKSYVFLHSTDIKDNAGVACIRSRQCRLLGGAQQPSVQGYGDVGADAEVAPRVFVPQSPGSAAAAAGGLGGGFGFGGGGWLLFWRLLGTARQRRCLSREGRGST